MKLQKSYFENLSLTKYRAYLKLLPPIRNENTRIVTTLILTFAAMSFFGAFAINPTLTTIVNLRRQLADSQLVYDKLVEKNKNLSMLLGQYNSLSSDLPTVFSAIPKTPSAPNLIAQVQALANKSNVTISSFRVSEVQLVGGTPASNGSSFVFFIEATGNYENMLNFANSLTKQTRIVTIESISIAKDSGTNALSLNVRARSYFKN